jgi:GH35 family endo-1,4-beta-xylanase
MVPVDPEQFFNQAYSGDPGDAPAPCCPPLPWNLLDTGGEAYCEQDGAHLDLFDNWFHVGARDSFFDVVAIEARCSGNPAQTLSFGTCMQCPMRDDMGRGLTITNVCPAGQTIIWAHIAGGPCGHLVATQPMAEADLPELFKKAMEEHERLCQFIPGLDTTPDNRLQISQWGYDGNPSASLRGAAFNQEGAALTCSLGAWTMFSNPGRDGEWRCDGETFQNDCTGFGTYGKCSDDALLYNNSLTGDDYTFSARIKFSAPLGENRAGIYVRGTVDENPPNEGQTVYGYYFMIGYHDRTATVQQLQTTNDDPILADASELACRLGSDPTALECAPASERCPNGTFGTCCNRCIFLKTLDNPWPKVNFPLADGIQENEWHTLAIRVEGDVGSFYVDDLSAPIGIMPLPHFDQGIVGLKTYQAVAEFQNVQFELHTSAATPDEPPICSNPLLYGVGTGWSSQRNAKKAEEASATITPVGFNWPDLESPQDTYHWDITDADVSAKTNHNLQLVGIIAGTPAWMIPGGSDVARTLPDQTQTNIDQFKEFVTAAVQRYPQITYWQFWNEPDGDGGGRLAAADYVFWLNHTYDALKTANPNAQLAAGGLQTEAPYIDRVNYVKEMYDAGAKFDAIAIHPYNYTGVIYTDAIEKTHEIMQNHGDGDKKVWVTEYGWNINDVSPAEQSDYLARSLDLLASGDYPYIELAIYLVTVDPPSGWGLMENLTTPRPAYSTFQRYASACSN